MKFASIISDILRRWCAIAVTSRLREEPVCAKYFFTCQDAVIELVVSRVSGWQRMFNNAAASVQ